MFSLSLFTVRENVEEEALYRGRADQISILGPEEEKKNNGADHLQMMQHPIFPFS